MRSFIRYSVLFSFPIFFFLMTAASVSAFPGMEKKSGGELGALSRSGMAGGILFQAPEVWKPTEPKSNMRLYQFEVPGAKQGAAELAVFYFPGTGGDVNGNIERWKQQFTTLNESVKPEPKKETINGISVTSVYLEGTLGSGMPGMPTQPQTGYAVLGAIAEGPQGPVFFKMMGPAETVKASQDDFSKFIQTFKTHP